MTVLKCQFEMCTDVCLLFTAERSELKGAVSGKSTAVLLEVCLLPVDVTSAAAASPGQLTHHGD